MKPLARLLAFASLFAVAQVATAAPQDRDLYSFADLYRLAAGGAELPAAWHAADAAEAPFRIRTAAAAPAAVTPPAPYAFSVTRAARPEGGLLVLAGLAAALWVARRRLGFAIRG